MQDVCFTYGKRMVDVALSFTLRHPAVVSVIPGGVGLAEMESNLAAAVAEIPDGLWAALKSDGLLHPDAPVSPL